VAGFEALSARSTGRDEENIGISGAHTIVENMSHGMAPCNASRVTSNNDAARLARFDLHFYAPRKDGAYASASLSNTACGAQGSPPRSLRLSLAAASSKH
jgi:hypothetical protein